MKKLLVISSAPAFFVDGKPYLDKKYCEGMQFYCQAWGGQVSSLLRKHGEKFPFGGVFEYDDLPFDLKILDPEEEIHPSITEEFDAILCSGDNFQYLYLADLCKGAKAKLFYTIEYTLKTRFQIVMLARDRGLIKKAYSLLWTLRQEYRRRRAFKLCHGIQANGYPAMNAYSQVCNNAILYLDNRIGADLLATEPEMQARRDRIRSGQPIEILHSGRLEPMKGSQDLVPIAKRLSERGVNFKMTVFGAGSLEEEIRKGVTENGLSDKVELNGPIDFETGLVPYARTKADLFLSCHRQSDPSCTYIESMGCGLPIAGYANEMWRGLRQSSQAGWIAPLGDWERLADQVAEVASQREEIISKADKAFSFASDHRFEQEFQRRVNHLKEAI